MELLHCILVLGAIRAKQSGSGAWVLPSRAPRAGGLVTEHSGCQLPAAGKSQISGPTQPDRPVQKSCTHAHTQTSHPLPARLHAPSSRPWTTNTFNYDPRHLPARHALQAGATHTYNHAPHPLHAHLHASKAQTQPAQRSTAPDPGPMQPQQLALLSFLWLCQRQLKRELTGWGSARGGQPEPGASDGPARPWAAWHAGPDLIRGCWGAAGRWHLQLLAPTPPPHLQVDLRLVPPRGSGEVGGFPLRGVSRCSPTLGFGKSAGVAGCCAAVQGGGCGAGCPMHVFLKTKLAVCICGIGAWAQMLSGLLLSAGPPGSLAIPHKC